MGRLASLTSDWVDGNHPATLASNFVYGASGAVTQADFGNGTRMTRTFNSGLQLKTLQHGAIATPGSLLNLEYNYQETVSNNGRIMGITNYNDRTKDLGFTYDRLYRLATAETAGTHWGLSWTYDRYGNRLTQSLTKGTGPTSSLTYSDTTNRVSGWSYDNAGNTLNDGRHVYTWNALNQQTTMDGGAAEYRYDPQGNRVMKITPTKTTYYVLGSGEYSGGVWEKLYVSLNGQKLLEYSNGTTYFFHSDHLGTPRVQTNLTGQVVETWDAYPFGEQWTTTGGVGNKHHYTGKERDPESANDYFGARYYFHGNARWLSVDPENSRRGPQQLNRYSYVYNDPVNLIDPDGRMTYPWSEGEGIQKPTSGGEEFIWGGMWFYVWDVELEQWRLVDSSYWELPVGTSGGGGARCEDRHDAFFKDMVEPATKLATQYNFDPAFLLALSAYESGWLDPHNRGLNNAFGLTRAGRRNLQFSSIEASVNYWGRRFGEKVKDASSIDDFINKLQTDERSRGGFGKYNTLNENWATDLKKVYYTVLRLLLVCPSTKPHQTLGNGRTENLTDSQDEGNMKKQSSSLHAFGRAQKSHVIPLTWAVWTGTVVLLATAVPLEAAVLQNLSGETEYLNENYLYLIAVPRGFKCEVAKPPAPDHGCRIGLSKGQEAYIFVDGSYNAAEYPSASDAFLLRMDRIFKEATEITVLSRFPTQLGGLPAERAVFTHRRVGDKAVILEDVVTALRVVPGRTEIIYTVGLISPPGRYRKDKEILDLILSSWRNQPPGQK